MQEAKSSATTPTGPVNALTWILMMATSIWGMFLCLSIASQSLKEMKDERVTFTLEAPTKFNLYADSTSKGQTSGLILPQEPKFTFVQFIKPNTPWLRLAFLFMGVSLLAYLRRLYLIARRKQAALRSTPFLAMTLCLGGLTYCAGEDKGDVAFLIGGLVIAQAGIGYLAYTGWERVRSQLCRP